MAEQISYLKRIEIKGDINGAWYRIGYITTNMATTFMIAASTYSNQYPAIFSVAAHSLSGVFNVDIRLIVGLTGNEYEPALMYKYSNGNIYFWAKVSNDFPCEVFPMSGKFIPDIMKETAPEDAVQPVVN